MKEIIEVKASNEKEDNKNFWDTNSFTILFGDIFVRIATILLIVWFLNFVRPKLKSVQELVVSNKETDEEIDNLLTKLCQLTKADRVLFGKLHNGSKYASGEHYPLFSARNEICEKGIGSIKNNIKSIDANLLQDEIIKLKESNFIFSIKDDVEEDCKNYMIKNNLEQSIDLAIRSKKVNNEFGKKVLIGIVSIQFLSISDKNNINNIKNVVNNFEELEKLRLMIEDEIENSRKNQTISILNVMSMLQSRT